MVWSYNPAALQGVPARRLLKNRPFAVQKTGPILSSMRTFSMVFVYRIVENSMKFTEMQRLVGGWTNPFEKYKSLVKLDHFPRDPGENKTYLSCHHLEEIYLMRMNPLKSTCRSCGLQPEKKKTDHTNYNWLQLLYNCCKVVTFTLLFLENLWKPKNWVIGCVGSFLYRVAGQSVWNGDIYQRVGHDSDAVLSS